MPTHTNPTADHSNDAGILPAPLELSNDQVGKGKFDLYQTITDKIIEAIEAGVQRDGKPLWGSKPEPQKFPPADLTVNRQAA